MGAYTIIEMGLYLSQRNRIAEDYIPLFRSDPALRNIYSVILLNPEKVPGTNAFAARSFYDFLVSDAGQDHIKDYGVRHFNSLFMTPMAHLDQGLRAERSAQKLAEKNTHIEQVTQLNTVLAGLLLMIIALAFSLGFIAKKRWLSQKQIALETQARIDAENACQDKSAFLANMSHEIRAPLTAIIGFSDLLQRNSDDPEKSRRMLQTIARNGEHLLHLVNDILDLSKLEAKRLQLEYSRFSLLELMNEIELLLADTIRKKTLDFSIEYRWPLPDTINSDKTRIKQVLINLCNNAMKFTEHGYVKICLDYESDKNQLRIAVIDSGIGMSQQQAAKLFAAYQQADASISRKYGGTGLGLSISRQIVEAMGGNIIVQSAVGEGSRFQFEISPGETSSFNLINALPASYAGKSSAAVEHQSCFSGNVLLVEDSVDNQMLISSYLSEYGVEVILARNGREAVELTSKNSFNLVLLDMQMPVMNGLEALEIMRQQNYNQPVVMLTGYTAEQDKARMFAAGCNDFLTKPINTRLLEKVLADYLPRRKSNTDPAIVSTLMGKSEKRDKLIRKFIDELPRLFAELHQTVTQNDYTKAALQLHNLKGVTGNYGFKALSDLCAIMESSINQQQFSQLAQQLQETDNLLQRIYSGAATSELQVGLDPAG